MAYPRWRILSRVAGGDRAAVTLPCSEPRNCAPYSHAGRRWADGRIRQSCNSCLLHSVLPAVPRSEWVDRPASTRAGRRISLHGAHVRPRLRVHPWPHSIARRLDTVCQFRRVGERCRLSGDRSHRRCRFHRDFGLCSNGQDCRQHRRPPCRWRAGDEMDHESLRRLATHWEAILLPCRTRWGNTLGSNLPIRGDTTLIAACPEQMLWSASIL